MAVRPVTAWVLPGGASFGASQAGMAKALLEADLAPDIVCGSSAGALNATWLAENPTEEGAAALADLWCGVRRREVFPIRPWTIGLGLIGRRDHTVSNGALAKWLQAHLPIRRLEESTVPLVVSATDLSTGDPVYLDRGWAVTALLASTAMPGVYPPVSISGRWLVDGGVSADAPIEVAVEEGATRVFVLTSVPAVIGGRPRAAADVLLRSIAVMTGRAHLSEVSRWSERCDIYVMPPPLVPGTSPFLFNHSRELVDAGYELARGWLASAQPVEAGMPLHLPA